MEGLDKKLDYIRSGENVVFRVKELEHFCFFSEEFLKEQKQNRTITKEDMEHLEQRLENMRFLNGIQKKNNHII